MSIFLQCEHFAAPVRIQYPLEIPGKKKALREAIAKGVI